MVLVKNLNFFSSLHCRLNRPGKCFFFVTLERKKAVFFYSKITKLKKSKFWYFSKGIRSMVFVKNLKFFHYFIFGKISQQNVFDDILEGKKALYSKMKKLKSQRIGIFPKGLIHGFG